MSACHGWFHKHTTDHEYHGNVSNDGGNVGSPSSGAALDRSLMWLMLNKLHNIVRRFPSRCFVIKSAGLIVPRIFSILGFLFCFSLLQPRVLRFHVFDGSNQFRCGEPALVLLQRRAHVSCWPVLWLPLHSEPCCSTLIRRCSLTPPSASTTTSSTCRPVRWGNPTASPSAPAFSFCRSASEAGSCGANLLDVRLLRHIPQSVVRRLPIL